MMQIESYENDAGFQFGSKKILFVCVACLFL
jgi:hypothetical protein